MVKRITGTMKSILKSTTSYLEAKVEVTRKIFTIKEYYEAKMLEKKKKHLLIPDDVDTVDEINEYRYNGEEE